MKYLYFNRPLSLLVLAMSLLCACSDDDDNNNDNDGPTAEVVETATTMEVSGTWKKGERIEIAKHVVVPEGKTLTIEPGVQVIFSAAGVGVNHAPIEFTVRGSLLVRGTASSPVLFSVPEALRTQSNTFAGMWGGIVATQTCPQMLIDHAVIEYTGGSVVEGSPAAAAGIYTAGGDAYPHITTTNVSGRYVITNSTLRYGWSDGVYLMGGQAIITDNTLVANGYSGAEGINIKAGVTADVARNIIYSPNTNGLKLSSAGQSEVRPQSRTCAYNNTIVGAGWRRDGEKGGSIYVEKNARVAVVNNLMANCKFRAQTPNYTQPCDPTNGWDSASMIDYNYYCSGPQRSSVVFDGPKDSGVATAYEGYNYQHKNYNPAIDRHSRIATADALLDPLFVAYPLATADLTSTAFDSAWDFSLQASSPARTGAYEGTDITPFFASNGLTVGDKKYTSPAIAAHFGAK